ncbi:hypothetical protein BJF89_08175 [Corynebacterium sp. CNJ-954]|uniref:AAA family ATPase n=1 Tax=Corynebacterium sp. CNJ-954 TaxID=1904962 RepID=UPI000969DF6F|nr:AAA family ATPase [Corynebacterium sp. CNJ-954]OLT51094.1 hypothetical protein BJF89_08175 [Corynebacterium sp. CNJ-954]
MREHYCLPYVDKWKDCQDSVQSDTSELNDLVEEIGSLRDDIKDLEASLSGTSETAEYISESLSRILGDGVLSIEVSESEGEYTVVRNGSPAENMSEGEKKLVGLLYFFSMLTGNEGAKNLATSIVVLDDVGSELDDSRLFLIDRFIVEFFDTYGLPASQFYLTHSGAYLRLLSARLGSKKLREGKSKFYEVYKAPTRRSGSEGSTRLRAWSDEAAAAPNDYSLAFYLTIENAKLMIDGLSVPLSAGNFSRKLLEGFTEFKEPQPDKVGVRVNNLVKSSDFPLGAAIPKLVNESSHSGLDKNPISWSQDLLSRSVMETLAFVKHVDPGHFAKMIAIYANESEQNQIESMVMEFLDNYSPS